MTHRTWTVFAYLAGGALLLAAACAPAAAPKPAAEQPAAPKPAAEQPAAPKPAVQQPAAPKPAVQQPAAPKPAVQQPAAPQPAKAAAVPPGEVGAKRGGVLVVLASRDPISFNAWEETLGTNTEPVMNRILQYKVWGSRSDPDYQTVVPDLARSWEWSADGSRFILRFQDGVKFHNGTPFTCADAKFTLDELRTGKGLRRSPRALFFRGIKEIACQDNLTMIIHMTWPQALLPSAIAVKYNDVHSSQLYESNPAKIKDALPVGTGPFKVVQYIPGEKLVLARNPDYWNKPYPYLDGLEIRNVGASGQYTGLRAGRGDALESPGYMVGAPVETLIKECKTCQVYERSWTNSFLGLHVNHQRKPWNTQEVKDAISYAIDRNKVKTIGFDGWLYPGGGPIHPANKEWSVANEPWLKEVPGYNLDDPEGNKKKARELLAKAGYQPGELKVTVPTWNTPSVKGAMVPIAEDLKAVGIDVTVRLVESALGYEIAGAGDFDLLPWSMGAGLLDPDGVFYEHYYTGSDRNYGRYSNPEVERLIDLQSRTLDPVERKRLVTRISEILMREQAKIVIGWYQQQPVVSGRVRNYAPLNCLHCDGSLMHERSWLAE